MKYIRDNLKIGMSTQEITRLFGGNYIEVPMSETPQNVKHLWRYDILTNENYKYKHVVDDVDAEGLTAGKVKIILFVDLSEKNDVVGYSYYYLNQDDGKVYFNSLSQNGTVYEDKIN